jgi:hypothetical protein
VNAHDRFVLTAMSDDHDSIFRNNAPPILSLLAVLAAILVLAVVVPARAADARRIVTVVLHPCSAR